MPKAPSYGGREPFRTFWTSHQEAAIPSFNSLFIDCLWVPTFNLRGKMEKKEIHGRERRVSLVSVNFTTDIIFPGKRPVVQVLCYMN